MGKTIWVTESEKVILDRAKANFELISGVRMSWGGFLTLVSLGALAGSAVTGARFRCPNCESVTMMTLECPTLIEPSEDSEELALSSSREPTARHKR